MKQFTNISFDFTGKTAIVTGASSGIFQSVAEGFGEAGARVAIIYSRNTKGAEVTKTAIEKSGSEARVYQCDVSKSTEVTDTVARIIEEMDGIDVLVNGAGVNVRSASEEYPEETWDYVMDVNCKGTFMMCRETGRFMLARGKGGKIVNCSSLLAWSGGLLVPAYAASKAGVHQLTMALCNEWSKHGINVNGVAPGYIETDITLPIKNDEVRNKTIMDRVPVGRWGVPDDIVGTVLFLASGASNFMHGVTLPVDGGWMAR